MPATCGRGTSGETTIDHLLTPPPPPPHIRTYGRLPAKRMRTFKKKKDNHHLCCMCYMKGYKL